MRTKLDQLLRRALIAEAICSVDRSDLKRIQNPYGNQPTGQMTAINGTYTVADYTTTDEALTVDQEVKVPEHIYDFEEVLTQFNIFDSRLDEMVFKARDLIDQFVLNDLTDTANGAYATPSGGFTSANIATIMSNLVSKVAGYSDAFRGMYLVIENTDIPGFLQHQIGVGFSFADSALKNGFMQTYMGVDIYVTRSGTFQDATIGTKTFTNANNRLFGIKGVSTYASPRDIRYTEKEVTLKTGKEVLVWGYVGHKLWTPKQDLVVDITLTA